MTNQIIELIKQTASLADLLVVELANPSWTGLDWDAPDGVDAAKYAELVESACELALSEARAALSALKEGRFDDVVGFLNSSAEEEFAFGDHPTWGPIRDAAVALAELATDVEADHPSDG